MKLSLVIPCYDEAKNIPLILERLKAAITRPDVEAILVNNGSRDGSQKVLDELLPGYPFARTVLVPVNRGYGYGIRQGLAAARGEYAGWTHADLQTDPSDALRALEIIERRGNPGAILVKGSRRGRPLFDQVFTVGMSLFETLYLGQRLWDINAQPNLFPRRFLESWTNPPDDFSLDLYALYLARKRGFEIVRFPVRFPPRIHGASSWNTGLRSKWKFIKRTLDFSVRLKKGLSS
ncbi:MAG: glycosyltransferase family 2 protein [Nitrospiraceae bacterium]|nr:glycosyltransferase family 2 protein [Nitrospiraceae bacterium]